MPPELRAFAVEQMHNDEEFQEGIGGQEIFDRLVGIVATPGGPQHER